MKAVVFSTFFGISLGRLFDCDPATEDCAVSAGPFGLRSFGDLRGMVEFTLGDMQSSWSKKEFKKRLVNYGCHCFQRDPRRLVGVGTPLDRLDHTCKELKRCRKCINLELINDDQDIHLVGYKFTMDDINGIVCEEDRNSEIQIAACECDRQFAETLATFWSEFEYNEEYWLSTSNIKSRNKSGLPYLNVDETCTVPSTARSTSGGNTEVCCGLEFPTKRPYDPNERECCETEFWAKSYSPNLKCCVDGNFLSNVGSDDCITQSP